MEIWNIVEFRCESRQTELAEIWRYHGRIWESSFGSFVNIKDSSRELSVLEKFEIIPKRDFQLGERIRTHSHTKSNSPTNNQWTLPIEEIAYSVVEPAAFVELRRKLAQHEKNKVERGNGRKREGDERTERKLKEKK